MSRQSTPESIQPLCGNWQSASSFCLLRGRIRRWLRRTGLVPCTRSCGWLVEHTERSQKGCRHLWCSKCNGNHVRMRADPCHSTSEHRNRENNVSNNKLYVLPAIWNCSIFDLWNSYFFMPPEVIDSAGELVGDPRVSDRWVDFPLTKQNAKMIRMV